MTTEPQPEQEYPYVQLKEAFDTLPVGAKGTLLDRYPQHNAGTVEFFDPVRWIGSVPLNLLEVIELHAGSVTDG